MCKNTHANAKVKASVWVEFKNVRFDIFGGKKWEGRGGEGGKFVNDATSE